MYSRTSIDVERDAAGILKKIYALKKLTEQVTLGFDVEWRPTFKKGLSVGLILLYLEELSPVIYC